LGLQQQLRRRRISHYRSEKTSQCAPGEGLEFTRRLCRMNNTFRVIALLNLNPAVEANWQAEIHLESSRSAVSAQAETHVKHMR
jgi:hypothetical protein